MRILESVNHVAGEYGIPTAQLKPCIALVLDGNVGGADRHDCAFTVAMELRRLGHDEDQVRAALRRWRRKVGYREREAERAIRAAFARLPDGRFKYHPPGLRKAAGGAYARVLQTTCEEVGCPANCPPFSNLHRGPRGESFHRFETLGWPRALRKERQHASVEIYRALCELERRRGLASGAPIRTSYRQLSELAGVNVKTAGRGLRHLERRALIRFEPGGGSGPFARDRQASRVVRTVPVPRCPRD